MTNLWRIHIKPAAKGRNPRKLCLEGGVLGVGWPVETGAKSLSWEEYYGLGKEAYKEQGYNSWRTAVNALRKRMQTGDLCWTRDYDGCYYLAMVTGPWEYRNDPVHLEADVVNIRPCLWVKVGTVDEVPGKVLSSFIPPRAVQRIDDATSVAYSMFLYNRLSGKDEYEIHDI